MPVLEHVSHTEQIAKWVGDDVQAAINSGVFADLPVMWGDSDGVGGPPVDDPCTIYFGLSLGEYADGGNQVIYQTTVEELVDELIEENEDGDILLRVADKLRALANKLEKAALQNKSNNKNDIQERG